MPVFLCARPSCHLITSSPPSPLKSGGSCYDAFRRQPWQPALPLAALTTCHYHDPPGTDFARWPDVVNLKTTLASALAKKWIAADL